MHVLGEGSQSRKATCYIIPCIWHCKRDKTARTENRSVVSRSWGWGEGMTTKDMKEFGRWRKRCASWLWWWLQDYWCMSRVLELYTKRVSSTECKLYLDKPDSSKKERIHSCKILDAWCFLENYTFMVSRQYMVTLLTIALVGSPFLSSSKGQKVELVAILLQGGNLDSATCKSPFQSVTLAKDTPPPWLTTEFYIRMTASFLFWLEDLGRLADLGPQP